MSQEVVNSAAIGADLSSESCVEGSIISVLWDTKLCTYATNEFVKGRVFVLGRGQCVHVFKSVCDTIKKTPDF